MRAPDPQQMFKRGDKNSDGKITKDEVPEFVWDRLSKADADKDGAVTPEEMKKAREQMREKMREKFKKAFEERMSGAKKPEKK